MQLNNANLFPFFFNFYSCPVPSFKRWQNAKVLQTRNECKLLYVFLYKPAGLM